MFTRNARQENTKLVIVPYGCAKLKAHINVQGKDVNKSIKRDMLTLRHLRNNCPCWIGILVIYEKCQIRKCISNRLYPSS